MTGTAKQAVAENYNSRVFRGIHASNTVFAQVIDDYVKSLLPNVTFPLGTWKWCARENATYLDCPVAEYADNTDVMIAAFNPASDPTDVVSVAVKHAFYTVNVWDAANAKWASAEGAAAVFCENETLSNNFTITNNCWLHVDYAIDGHQLGLIQLLYNASVTDLEVVGKVELAGTIETSDYEKITLNGYDNANGHSFSLVKKSGQKIDLYADLRYWPAFGNNDLQSSGAYIFRVEDNVTESLRYSHFQGLLYFNTTFLS